MKQTLGKRTAAFADRFVRFCVYGLIIYFLLYGCFCIASNARWDVRALLVAALLPALAFAVSRIAGRWRFGWLVPLLLAFSVRLLMLYVWPITPISDFAETLELAQGVLDPAKFPSYYTAVFPNLMPWVVYESLALRLFGGSAFALQIINACASAGTCAFLYGIALSLTRDRHSALLASTLQALNPFNFFFVSVQSCQHIATFLTTAGLYLLFCPRIRRKWLRWLLGGCVIALSQLFRTEMAVVLIAALCYGAYRLVLLLGEGREARRRAGEILLCGLLFFAGYFGVIRSADAVLLRKGLVERSISSGTLSYKIAVGMNYETGGAWSREDAAFLLDEAQDPDEREQLNRSVAASRLWATENWPELFSIKTEKLIGDYEDSWQKITDKGEAYEHFSREVLPLFTRGAMLGIQTLACVGLFALLRRGRKSPLLLFAVILLGFLLAFLFIEVQIRYAQILLPFLCLLAAHARLPHRGAGESETEKKEDVSPRLSGGAENNKGDLYE
ncbi:MAG: glycosyltransferase family 39 protein [Clostridia bacterium]|nr:glycosyltransferase family 39 protein [Clostridia bacterium]